MRPDPSQGVAAAMCGSSAIRPDYLPGYRLVVALTLGALTGFQLLNVTPSSAPITELPLALIPAATVPLFSPCT